MEFVEKIEDVTLDERNSDKDDIFIDFVINDMPYYIHIINQDCYWEPIDIRHSWVNGAYCEVCETKVDEHNVCSKMAYTEKVLHDFSVALLNHPKIRLKALLFGVILQNDN